MKDAIGVIGGMGPLASQLFYKMITEHTAAECDQDHVPLLILSDVTMPEVSGGIWLYGGGCDMQYRTFLYGYD